MGFDLLEFRKSLVREVGGLECVHFIPRIVAKELQVHIFSVDSFEIGIPSDDTIPRCVALYVLVEDNSKIGFDVVHRSVEQRYECPVDSRLAVEGYRGGEGRISVSFRDVFFFGGHSEFFNVNKLHERRWRFLPGSYP